MYIGIFDTDFDKYVDDAVMLFKQSGITTVFEQLEGFPKDWRENLLRSPSSRASIKLTRSWNTPNIPMSRAQRS